VTVLVSGSKRPDRLMIMDVFVERVSLYVIVASLKRILLWTLDRLPVMLLEKKLESGLGCQTG